MLAAKSNKVSYFDISMVVLTAINSERQGFLVWSVMSCTASKLRGETRFGMSKAFTKTDRKTLGVALPKGLQRQAGKCFILANTDAGSCLKHGRLQIECES